MLKNMNLKLNGEIQTSTDDREGEQSLIDSDNIPYIERILNNET